MDYKKHYDSLMKKARDRKIDGYSEKHHIVPKCLGGSNSVENLVRLTPEEHFVAHQLLVKIYPENRYIILAVKMMTVSGGYVIRNNKMFGWLRKRFSKAMEHQVVSDETRKKMSIAKISNSNKKGKEVSLETKIRLSSAAKGRKHTEETKHKISIAGKRPCLEETKIKIGLANKGRILPPITESTRIKLSDKARGRIYEKISCPHCAKEGGITGMKRWHFENCKEKV